MRIGSLLSLSSRPLGRGDEGSLWAWAGESLHVIRGLHESLSFFKFF